MKQSLSRILAALLCVFVFYGVTTAANPKREARSTWLTTVWGIDWPSTTGTSASVQAKQKAQMITILDNMKKMNMTTVCFQVRSMSDAMYRSKYCPWSSYLTGNRGADPGWDPLAFVVEECHKRGLECYAWLNPYRFSSGTKWNTAHDREMQNDGWLLTHDGKYITLNPALDKCRKRIVDVCKEVVVGYDVDGILFDDYFYPNHIVENSNADDYQLWKNSGSSLSIGDWRRENVNKMVKDVYDMIQANRPDVRFGISPAGVACTDASVAAGHGIKPCPRASDWQYRDIYSDPVAWVKAGTVDFISPQIYWLTTNGTAPYGPIADWWSYVAGKFGRHFYSSHSISLLGGDNSQSNWQDIEKQIKLNRQYTENNAPGSFFYSTKYLYGPSASGLGEYLRKGVFSQRALTPAITWKKSKNLGKVSNLALNNGQLTWNAVSDGKSNIRYTVYAVPQSVTLDNALAADGDGIKVDYLLDTWYYNNYTLPSSKTGAFWYAVCVYDGYSNEYEPAIVNYPAGESQKVTLTSPINGAVAQWENTFSWSNVPGAVYNLQIASDNAFKNILYNEKEITQNSLVLDLYKLTGEQTYYWRVSCREPGKLESMSATATFRAPEKTPGKPATLIAPADGAKPDGDFSFSWNAAGDIDEVQVSEFRDFSKIKYSAQVGRSSATSKHRMSISLLGKGYFYWRIVSKYKHYKDAVSATRTFEITKVVTGETEPGYVIKTDDGSYPMTDNVKVENMWFRSIREGYTNHPVETTGMLTRAMTVKDGIIYISERAENSESSEIYLCKINASTGEVLGKLKLSDEGKLPYFPCNDVVKDSKGTVCISNMVLNASTYSVKLHSVDLKTGQLTERASVNTPEAARIDHVAVYGDVAGGNFKMFAASASKDIVYRWTYTNGSLAKTEMSTLRGFYPANAGNMGIAPRIVPVDENKIFVDGGATMFSLYDFSNGRMIDSFANNPSIAPEGLSVSGGAYFAIGETRFVAYPYGDNRSSNGYQFAVSKTDANYSFANMTQIAVMPQKGFGTYNSSTVQASIAYEAAGVNSVNVYFYVPGDGLACYRVTDNNYTGSCDLSDIDELTVVLANNELVFSETVESVSVYSAAGALAAVAENVQTLPLELEAGAYVVNAVSNGKTVRKVVIVR